MVAIDNRGSKVDITCFQGLRLERQLTCLTNDKQPVDFGTVILKMQVYKPSSNPELVLNVELDYTGNVVDLVLTTEQMKQLTAGNYDYRIVQLDGAETLPFLHGTLNIIKR